MPRNAKSHVRALLRLDRGEHYERTTIRNSRRCVINRTPFYAGKETLYGCWVAPDRYVVYSYGDHFPIYIWDDTHRQWYGNRDKYSRTTSRHQSAACPISILNPTIHWLATDTMRSIAQRGVFDTVVMAVEGDCSANWG